MVVGGVADHVHILFDMGKMLAPVKFVEQVRHESSKFVKTLGAQYAKFYWQRGYGMFSVSPKDRGDADHYVRNQEDHHRQMTFQDEYRAMLTRYGIEFDGTVRLGLNGAAPLPMNMAFGQTSCLRIGYLGRCPRLR